MTTIAEIVEAAKDLSTDQRRELLELLNHQQREARGAEIIARAQQRAEGKRKKRG